MPFPNKDNFKKKNEDSDSEDQPNDLKNLTGSPSMTAVSDVAKGGEATSLNEMDKAYEELNAQVRQGERSEMPDEYDDTGKAAPDHKAACTDIDQAYAMLFESLAVIIKSK